ncbi:MAG: hypothetical protein QOJ07_658 [Thermoleophilaceae bacterium]|nr:hypothetical protein [Thermoleophilaceae bacterium]
MEPRRRASGLALFVLALAAFGAVAYTVLNIHERHEPIGPPGKLVGVNVHPLWQGVSDADAQRILDLTERSGANVVRVDVGWASMQPDGPGAFANDYARRADAFIHAARGRGLRVIVTLLGTPCWASSAPESLRQGCRGRWYDRGVPAYAPRDPADFAAFAGAVARRWAGDVDAIEVWNEPNQPFFWRAHDPAGEYARLLRAAYPAIKKAAPRVTVLGGALAYADGAFLRELYHRGHILGSYDAISIHPYTLGRQPSAPRQHGAPRKLAFRSGTRWIRDTMRAAGDRHPEVWLTEVGASTCPEGEHAECVSEADQARYVTDSVAIARHWSFVKAIVVYSLLDDGADASKVVNRYGLASADGRPKPALAAFRRAAGAG